MAFDYRWPNCRPPAPGKSKVLTLLGKSNGLTMLQTGQMMANEHKLALAVASGDRSEKVSNRILRLAKDLASSPTPSDDPWLKQLDWMPVRHMSTDSSEQKPSKPPKLLWPKWYWDLARPRKDFRPELSTSRPARASRRSCFACPGKVGLSFTPANMDGRTAYRPARHSRRARSHWTSITQPTKCCRHSYYTRASCSTSCLIRTANQPTSAARWPRRSSNMRRTGRSRVPGTRRATH
jgi:hypothetical protein